MTPPNVTGDLSHHQHSQEFISSPFLYSNTNRTAFPSKGAGPQEQPLFSPALTWHSATHTAKKHKPESENPRKATFLLMTLEESPGKASRVIQGAKLLPNLISLSLLQKSSHCTAALSHFLSPLPRPHHLHHLPASSGLADRFHSSESINVTAFYITVLNPQSSHTWLPHRPGVLPLPASQVSWREV